MAITPLPEAPSRAVPATFSDLADAFLAALATFVTEANALETNVNAKEVDAAASAVLAAASEAVALAASNYVGPWADQAGAANVPCAVSHLDKYWQLTENLADVTAKTPGTDPEWLIIGALPGHAADHILGGADEIDGDKIDIDFTPSNYTPDVSPAEVTNVDELTAHLKGIDKELVSFVGALIRPKFIYTETLKFNAGTNEFVAGETVTGNGGGTGVIVYIEITSGAWATNDAAGNMFINTRNTTAFVQDEALTGSVTGAAAANGASTKDSIVLYPGSYHHAGTSTQIARWVSKIGFIFGSGGSNAASVDLDASNFFYLYIDDSAVVAAGTNILTASEFVANKVCADFVDAKMGKYTGNDRMIFGVYSDSGSEIAEFFHDADTVMWADSVETQAAVDIDDTWTDINALRIPAFATIGLVGRSRYAASKQPTP